MFKSIKKWHRELMENCTDERDCEHCLHRGNMFKCSGCDGRRWEPIPKRRK